jgi:hypothetical protein
VDPRAKKMLHAVSERLDIHILLSNTVNETFLPSPSYPSPLLPFLPPPPQLSGLRQAFIFLCPRSWRFSLMLFMLLAMTIPPS